MTATVFSFDVQLIVGRLERRMTFTLMVNEDYLYAIGRRHARRAGTQNVAG